MSGKTRSAPLLAVTLLLGITLGWVAGHPAAENPLPPGEHVDLVTGRCVICHGLELVAQQRLGRAAWEVILDRMLSYGMPMAPEEREPILTYLVTRLGP
jgi:hypothetical protein